VLGMERKDTLDLAVAVVLFFLASNLTGVFLPIYFVSSGLAVNAISTILFLTFAMMGLVPLILIRLVRNFERIMSLGILMSAFFYAMMVYAKNPILLGICYGLSQSTFWPSFNLLQFRFSEGKGRAFFVILMSVVIPGASRTVGPALGGWFVANFGFVAVFAVSIILFLSSFIFSLRIKYKPESTRFSLPRNRIFMIFMATFVIVGFCESYWLAYPLFVDSVSHSLVKTGLIFSASSLVMLVVQLIIGRLSDLKLRRREFAALGSLLNALWYFGLVFATIDENLVALSFLGGLATALYISWFVYYGDSYNREKHGALLVMMELGLACGRILNLVPVVFYVSSGSFSLYFLISGIASLLLFPLYIGAKTSKGD
jgi:MFS family permease